MTDYLDPSDPNRPPIDLNRPIINNPDGSFSTERSITVGMDGKFFNIPTIVQGQQLDPAAAIEAFRAGKNPHVGVFSSQQEAEEAATRRSEAIGRLRHPLMGPGE